MAELLFKLTNVPADEAEEVRNLLGDSEIEFYETSAGTWGVGVAAIWLPDDSQLTMAKDLLEGYQLQRAESAQQSPVEHTLLDNIKQGPARFVVYLAVIATILYISISPFILD